MAYLIWGLALKNLGQKEEALAPLRLGVSCRPDQVDFQIALAQVLLDLGKEEEASRHLDDALRLDAKDPRVAPLMERLRSNKSKR